MVEKYVERDRNILASQGWTSKAIGVVEHVRHFLVEMKALKYEQCG